MHPARKLWRKIRHSVVPYKTEDGIPITNEPPTAQIRGNPNRLVRVGGKEIPDPLIRPGDKGYPSEFFNAGTLAEVHHVSDKIRSALIVNGTDRQVIFTGPPLAMVLAPGEQRRITAPILQRVPRPGSRSVFDIEAMDPVQVLEDMVAERQRSIERDGNVSWGVIDRLDQRTLLDRSKIKVFPLDVQA